MTVLPVGAVGSSLASLTGGASSALTAAGEAALGGNSSGLSLNSPSGAVGKFAGSSALEGVEAGSRLAGAAGVEGVGGSATGSAGAAGSEGAGGAGAEGGFGEALTHAISSLEATQRSSDGAAQALATGTAGNPESAVVTVEDAQLAMQLASQVRTKAVEAVQQVFQTQV